jgi:hypothetical protein
MTPASAGGAVPRAPARVSGGSPRPLSPARDVMHRAARSDHELAPRHESSSRARWQLPTGPAARSGGAHPPRLALQPVGRGTPRSVHQDSSAIRCSMQDSNGNGARLFAHGDLSPAQLRSAVWILEAADSGDNAASETTRGQGRTRLVSQVPAKVLHVSPWSRRICVLFGKSANRGRGCAIKTARFSGRSVGLASRPLSACQAVPMHCSSWLRPRARGPAPRVGLRDP